MKTKLTAKEQEKRRILIQKLGSHEYYRRLKIKKKQWPMANSEANLVNEMYHEFMSTCTCRIDLDSLPEEKREELREKVRQHNEQNGTSISVYSYLKQFGVKP